MADGLSEDEVLLLTELLQNSQFPFVFPETKILTPM